MNTFQDKDTELKITSKIVPQLVAAYRREHHKSAPQVLPRTASLDEWKAQLLRNREDYRRALAEIGLLSLLEPEEVQAQ